MCYKAKLICFGIHDLPSAFFETHSNQSFSSGFSNLFHCSSVFGRKKFRNPCLRQKKICRSYKAKKRNKKNEAFVNEPPVPPKIEDNTNLLPAGEPYPTQEGKQKRLHCISRKGNPPAKLKWFIDDTDITSMSNQTNSTDVDKPKTWQAVSVLDYVFQKDHNNKMLKCVAIHAAYDTLTKDIKIPLEVL
ncbi:hypothetical protein AVEN_258548-1, partial [Araneus ventricosus]